MAPTYKLYFVEGMRRNGGIQVLLAHIGIQYEKHPIAEADLPEMKQNLPFGKVPVLEVDGVRITVHHTIARYLAREHGLVGKNALESAQCDMIVTILDDALANVAHARTETDLAKKEEMKKKFVTETILHFSDNLEKILIKNGTGYIVGNSLTWADIVLGYVMSSTERKLPDSLKNYPNIREHSEKIMNLPNIKKWVEERSKSS